MKRNLENLPFPQKSGLKDLKLEVEKEALCTTIETPKSYLEQRRSTQIKEEIYEKMGEAESMRGLRNLSGRKFLL